MGTNAFLSLLETLTGDRLFDQIQWIHFITLFFLVATCDSISGFVRSFKVQDVCLFLIRFLMLTPPDEAKTQVKN